MSAKINGNYIKEGESFANVACGQNYRKRVFTGQLSNTGKLGC
ncbi:MAG TPA: hypothetical protein VGE06_05655 [Flavisolibacter sp.]